MATHGLVHRPRPSPQPSPRAGLYVRWTRGRWPLEQIFPLRGLKKAGLMHDKFMFAQRPRPLTPALPEGAREQCRPVRCGPLRSNAFRLPLPPAGGEGWGEGSPKNHIHLHQGNPTTSTIARTCSTPHRHPFGDEEDGVDGGQVHVCSEAQDPHPSPLPEGAREQCRPARCGPLRSNALRLPLPRRGERVGVRGLPKITSISIKATRRPPPSAAPARPLPATRLAMTKAGLTHDRFMFDQRPRPLTPALSPKGRGSNTGQFAVARFGVTHYGSLSPGGGEGWGEGSPQNHIHLHQGNPT